MTLVLIGFQWAIIPIRHEGPIWIGENPTMTSRRVYLVVLAALIITATLFVWQHASAYITCCKWATNSASYKYDLSLPSTFYYAVDKGASQWTGSDTSSWYWIVNSPSSINVVAAGIIDGPLGVAAQTIKWKTNSKIIQMKIEFDSEENWNTRAIRPTADQVDLLSVSTHEFGHALGLRHTQPMPYCPNNSTASTMCNTLALGTNYMRNLEDDDENGLWSLYP